MDAETANLIAQRGCYLTPTLVTYKIMASQQFKGFLDKISQEEKYQVLSRGLDSLQLAKDYGVKLCFGMDLLGSLVGYQTQEFFIRSKVLTPQEILLSATVTPAEMNGVGDRLGQIKEGYTADILLLQSDPLENIEVLDEPDKELLMVMKDGLVYSSKLQEIPVDIQE